MKKYIWCEDARSGYEFWNIFFSELAPDAVVESKRNNSELRKAVSQINNE